MELMQKYSKEDGAIGVENLDRWPSDSEAVGFLSITISASSMAELKRVGYSIDLYYNLTFPASVISAFLAKRRAYMDGGISQSLSTPRLLSKFRGQQGWLVETVERYTRG